MELKEFIKKFSEQFDDTPVEYFLPDAEFKEFEEWSSLSSLTIIAMVDEEFGVTIKAENIRGVDTIEELYDLILSMVK